MQTFHWQFKMKSKTECPFLMCILFVKIKHLPHLPTVTSGTVYTLAYRFFELYSCWNKPHTELVCLKQIFLKNSNPENFINKCFKRFVDNIYIVKETNVIIEKEPLVLVLPCLGSISLQIRTKLKKSLKTSLVVVNSQ